MNFLKSKKYSWLCYAVLFVFLAVASTLSVAAQSNKPENISIHLKNQPVEHVFSEISRQTGLKFFYGETVVNNKLTVSIGFNNTSVSTVLEEVSKQTKLYFSRENNTISVSHRKIETSSPDKADQKKVQGTVLDENKEPVIGVNVLIKGTSTGTITDIDGHFYLDAHKGETLLFSYIGYLSKEVRVDGSILQVQLLEDTQKLDEVVVVGYGSVRKKDVTTSVAIVSTDDIQERPIVSAASAIQGKAAGVQVVQASGKPGAGVSIRVRGSSSIQAGNEPLYVVDGLPMSDISTVAPSDIESMQILKDASSSAIYGARAANGVVLITTKKGKTGQPQLKFNSYVGISNVRKKPQALNTEQYLDYLQSIEWLSGTIPEADLPSVRNIYTNWADEVFRTGVNQNYQLSYSGGSEKNRYYVSGGYAKDLGTVVNSDYHRYNFRANLDTEVKKWLTIGANFSYTNSMQAEVPEGRADLGGVIQGILVSPPYIHTYAPDGSGKFDSTPYGSSFDHPMANTTKLTHSKNNRLIGGVNLLFSLLPGLKFKPSIAFDYTSRNSDYFVDPFHTQEGRSQNGIATDTRWSNLSWINENMLTYDRTFNKKHNLSVLAGVSVQKNRWEQLYMGSRRFGDFQSSFLPGVGLGNLIDSDSGNKGAEWALLSYIGRVSYNYEGKYLVTANVRADGSSKLAPENRWGWFPSVSAGWRLSSEEFMRNLTFVNDLKLRIGVGQNGNQGGISEYSYMQLYNFSRTSGNAPSITKGQRPNRSLTWETTTQTNLGLDVELFNSRLLVTVDAYYKKTRDLLLDVQFPNTYSNDIMTFNMGSIENKGIEFAISSKNILKNDFQWSTDFNMSFNRNKILDLGSIDNIPSGLVNADSFDEYAVLLKVGQPVGVFYGYKSLGVDPNTGQLMFDVAEGNDPFDPDPTDRQIIGDPNPKFIYGLTNTLSYKDFSLNVFFQGSYGNDIFNAGRMYPEGMQSEANQSIEVLKRWRKPGDITSVPGAGNVSNVYTSSHYIEDGSYLRLKTLSLSYNLPKSLLSRISVDKVQLYVTAENLFTITKYKGYDPEVNAAQFQTDPVVSGIDFGTYPQTRTFIFGVNLEF